MAHAFSHACDDVGAALDAGFRAELTGRLATAPTLGEALERLRDSMRAHVWKAGARQYHLDGWVRDFDRRSRREGLHALNDWDGVSDAVNSDIIPVDVLSYLISQRGADPADRIAPAVLIDYYFLYLLALLSLRIWDDSEADENLDRLGQLLATLQGSEGSGQGFAADAGTLLLVATSHYEIEEHGYAGLLERVRTLDERHQLRTAVCHAGSLGCHLRFGLEVTYGRDIGAMREDNAADYPWLLFALVTVMREYVRMLRGGIAGEERDAIVLTLLNGLSADARAFVAARPPKMLAGCEEEWTELRDLLASHRHALAAEGESHRPSPDAYSPLSFFFNFSQNVLKGAVIDALLWSAPRALTFNDMLGGAPGGGPGGEARLELATTLMSYARANPDRIRGQLTPVVVYDPRAGRRAFGALLRDLAQ